MGMGCEGAGGCVIASHERPRYFGLGLRCYQLCRRGAQQGQAPSHRGALGGAHGAAVPFAGDGKARGCPAASQDAARPRGLSGCGLAIEAACRERAAVGGEPQSGARVCAQGRGKEPADRVRRPSLQFRGGRPAQRREKDGHPLLYRVLEGRGHRPQPAQLPRLPEAAAELRAVAKNLGAPEASIHLRADASESTVKHAALSDYRVVYFATHGLVAGEVKGLSARPNDLCRLQYAPTTTRPSPSLQQCAENRWPACTAARARAAPARIPD
jgi:CHAT domain